MTATIDGLAFPSPLDFYRAMFEIRRLEERLMDLKQQGLIVGSVHLCAGQEAIPVGASVALGADDVVAATYRGHGWAMARGVPSVEILAEVLGRANALSGGRGGSANFSSRAHQFLGESAIVGGGVPMAMGAALAFQLRSERRIAAVSIGDGALNQGAVHEAMNMASVFRLPLVIIVENNGYAEMTPTFDMLAIDRLSDRAAGYGMRATTVDGNDPRAVASVMHEACQRARAGEGPTMVEALTQRISGHYSGDLQHYRPKGDLERARQAEPLGVLQAAIGDDQAIHGIERDVDIAIDVAIEAAKRRPLADPAAVLEHLYA